jgi:hypothetical protein
MEHVKRISPVFYGVLKVYEMSPRAGLSRYHPESLTGSGLHINWEKLTFWRLLQAESTPSQRHGYFVKLS